MHCVHFQKWLVSYFLEMKFTFKIHPFKVYNSVFLVYSWRCKPSPLILEDFQETRWSLLCLASFTWRVFERFIHVVVCISIPFLSMAEEYPIVYSVLFVHQLMDIWVVGITSWIKLMLKEDLPCLCCGLTFRCKSWRGPGWTSAGPIPESDFSTRSQAFKWFTS